MKNKINLILPSIFIIFPIGLIIFSNSNFQAAKSGLNLWANSVIPSLFPFFISTELLLHTNIIHILGKKLNFLMKPLFNVPGEGSFAFIMGLLSGYPVGAKIATNLRQTNICSKEECERLLSFTNNSSPLFIVGTIGISMFGDSTIGFLLLISHILASITVGICFRFYKSNFPFIKNSINTSQKNNHNPNISISNLGEILNESITSSITTILNIGGFIILFSIIISLLNSCNILIIFSNIIKPFTNLLHIPSSFITPTFTGFIELTNGIKQISDISYKKISINIILTSCVLGFGGVSILLQVWSIISKTDLSIKPYFIGKILHSIFSILYTIFLLYFMGI